MQSTNGKDDRTDVDSSQIASIRLRTAQAGDVFSTQFPRRDGSLNFDEGQLLSNLPSYNAIDSLVEDTD